MSNSVLIYRGPSLINGEAILVFATLKSANRKTGDVVQTTIVPDGAIPSVASKTPAVDAVCGSCALKRTQQNVCYVRIEESVDSVARAYYSGNVQDITGDDAAITDIGSGRVVRLGAYGDPAAVPATVWKTLCEESSGVLGYTHQWLTMDVEPWTLRHCMLSCENEEQAKIAHKYGFRSYRVRPAGARLMSGEINCPEPASGIQCERCGLCDGAKLAKSISIEAKAATINWVKL